MRQPVPFGKYILLDRVSVGGMAEVFKAKSFGVEGFEKVIAIKRILPSMGEDRDFIDMFIDEAKIAGQLAHANICQIFELGKIDGSHFIAMEYIWGKDLLQLQNRMRKVHKVMELPMACFIISKVCEGLDYAHRKRSPLGQAMNIVHRDCSPQNILISYEGEVKLIDFGIAKAASRSSKTVAGVLKGKFGYMSPEQVRGLALDRRSDIFAVGTVLYECITGERLFQCESDFSTLEKVRNVSIFPPSHFNRNVPAELERIVMKALARNPEERYQWASDLQADLQQLLMKQERVFTAKSLGSFIKNVFSAELNRERSLMEQYKRIGRDGRPQAATPPPEPAHSLISGGMAGNPYARGKTANEQSDFDDGPTEIFGELTIDEDPDDVAALVAQAKAEPLRPPEPVAPRRARTAPPSPPPAAAGTPGRAISEEPTVAKVVVRETTPAPAPVSSTLEGHGPLATGTSPRTRPDEISFGSTAAVSPIPPAKKGRRSSVLKDVGIGLGIAALVLVIFAGAKILFFGEKPGTRAAEASTGTIAVTVPDSDPADVHINGERVGRLEGGEALQLGELAPGDYQVVVRRSGVPDCVRKVDLRAKALEVVNCPFETPAPRPARLILRGAMEGAVVFVDGQQVSEEAAHEPMMLAPNIGHVIRVEREDAPEHEFTVRLMPGQETTSIIPEPHKVVARKHRPRRERGFAAFVAAEGKKLTNEADGKRDSGKRDASLERHRKGDGGKGDGGKGDGGKGDGGKGDGGKGDGGKGDDSKVDGDNGKADDGTGRKKALDKGYLVAWTTPWARVFIDGKDTGKMTPIAPRAKIALKPGKHRVTFVVGAERFSYPVVIEPGQTVRLREKLPVKVD